MDSSVETRHLSDSEQPPLPEHVHDHEHLGSHAADGWRGRLSAIFDRFSHPSKHKVHPDHEKRARDWDSNPPEHVINAHVASSEQSVQESQETLSNNPDDRKKRLEAAREVLSDRDASVKEKFEKIDGGYQNERVVQEPDDQGNKSLSEQEKRLERIARDRDVLKKPISFQEKAKEIAERREKDQAMQEKDLVSRVGGIEHFNALRGIFESIQHASELIDQDMSKDELIGGFKRVLKGSDPQIVADVAEYFMKDIHTVSRHTEDSPEVDLQEAIYEVSDDIEKNTHSVEERSQSDDGSTVDLGEEIRARNEHAKVRREEYIKRTQDAIAKMTDGDEEGDGSDEEDSSQEDAPRRRMLGGWVTQTLEDQVRRKRDRARDDDEGIVRPKKRTYMRRSPTQFRRNAA